MNPVHELQINGSEVVSRACVFCFSFFFAVLAAFCFVGAVAIEPSTT